MIIIIAGGRDFIPLDHHWQWLDEFARHQQLKGDQVTEVVSGRQRGADRFGEDWAVVHNHRHNNDLSHWVKITPFPVRWEALGYAAGPIRNTQMAEYLIRKHREGHSVAVILFPGGRGTQSMYHEAIKREITVFDWRERTAD